MLQTNHPLSFFTSVIKDMVDPKRAAKDAPQSGYMLRSLEMLLRALLCLVNAQWEN